MTQTLVIEQPVHDMTDTSNHEGTGRLTYRQAVAKVSADPDVTYCLRQRIDEDEARSPVEALKEAQMLVRLAELRLQEGLGANPSKGPAPGYRTAEERAEAFVESDAILSLEGYQKSADFDALQRRIVAGDISSDDAVQEIIRRAQEADTRKA